ncbi:MAG: hypothetical protein ACYS22_05215 [Planctomycetota bacterium]|jgi:hypothetical protein
MATSDPTERFALRLARLQILTLAFVVGAVGVLVYSHFVRPAKQGAESGASSAEVKALRDQASAHEASVTALAQRLGQVEAETGNLGALEQEFVKVRSLAEGVIQRSSSVEQRAKAVEQRADAADKRADAADQRADAAHQRADAHEASLEALREASRRGLRVVPFQRWVLLSFRGDGRQVEVTHLDFPAGKAPAFPEELRADVEYRPVAARTAATLPIAADFSELAFGAGVVMVSVALRTDNDVREERGKPNQLWLRAVDPGLTPRADHPLFGHFFRVDDRNPTDPLIKTATGFCAVPVTPKTQLELVLDTQALAARLKTRGTGLERRGRLDVLIGVGPLLADAPQGGDR